ncbi:hypothetical protein SLEP1_g46088 [Rubroshorea leprosula]|uniref:Uncharacterized protein n=1 Tax=Rubroshorea leprosula TaxID=152421 RepID=A0AAV5LM07_9ROSI|nr:hypothetical protein SLEP1_g46088 [Rubroshorea leprosula]
MANLNAYLAVLVVLVAGATVTTGDKDCPYWHEPCKFLSFITFTTVQCKPCADGMEYWTLEDPVKEGSWWLPPWLFS